MCKVSDDCLNITNQSIQSESAPKKFHDFSSIERGPSQTPTGLLQTPGESDPWNPGNIVASI